MSRFLLAGGFIASIFLLFLANPVLAGGGPIFIDLGSTISSWNNPSSPRQIVAKVHLHPDVPCIGTKITFKYEEQKDGDDVSTGSGGPSYVIQEVGGRWLNGKSVYDCGTYAKYTSKNKELKYGIILVTTPQGQTHERKVALNFQSDEPIQSSGDNLPWDNEVTSTDLVIPSNLRITQIETTGDPNTRNVHLMWDPIPGVNSYNVYTAAGGSYKYYTTVDTNLYEMKVNIGSTFYVAVTAKKDNFESSYSSVVTIDLTGSNYVPPSTISNTITAWVLSQQLDGNNRQVTLKWSAFNGNPGTFSVMVKPTSNKKDWDKTAWEQRGPSVTITIPNADYYVKLYGCANKYGNCNESDILWLPKIKVENETVVVPSVVPVTSNAEIDEVNKKVNDLQNQLDQSRKTQNLLEQRINDLVNFIKSLFPFFK